MFILQKRSRPRSVLNGNSDTGCFRSVIYLGVILKVCLSFCSQRDVAHIASGRNTAHVSQWSDVQYGPHMFALYVFVYFVVVVHIPSVYDLLKLAIYCIECVYFIRPQH